jgi:transposase, IS5 family
MYKAKDRKTQYLFEELFPFGGKLDENNRWMKLAGLIPWEKLEKAYVQFFSESKGRPGTDARLCVGLFLLKHLSGMSDRGLILELQENPYWQYFCGLESFTVGSTIKNSTLSKLRHRLGPKYVRELEALTYGVLIEKKIIRPRGLMADGTVLPENIKYPNDVGVMNDAREWLVKKISEIGQAIGKRYRTYRRAARKAYLCFSKKKRKTKKEIARAKKQMLQYVRRNIEQLSDAIKHAGRVGLVGLGEIGASLEIARKIYAQQHEMYRTKSHQVKERIVSFVRPWVRPIKRGKNGKDVEFGAKAAVSYVDGMLFLDVIEHENFAEAETAVVRGQIESYENRFGQPPPSFTADKAYGSRGNREYVEGEKKIRTSFVRLGKKQAGTQVIDRWFKKKQRERNRIEGAIGNGKEHYCLDSVKYHGPSGAEMWTRYGLLAMNLKVALARI